MIVLWILYMIITLPNTTIGFKGTNLKLLELYLSNLIVIMGIGGLLLMTIRKNKNSLLFLIITLTFGFFYINNVHNQPMAPWTLRRYITVVIPALMIGHLKHLQLILDTREHLGYLYMQFHFL